MSVQIECRYSHEIPFDVEKVIRKLMSRIPPEHLIGLGKVIVLDEVTHKRNAKSGGIYFERAGEQPPRIEIAVNTIYAGMPRLVFYCPFVAKFMLANVLYHEIGHHYQHFTHGITKTSREDFAENYKRQMLKRSFFWWLLLLAPLSPIIRWLNHFVNKRRS